MKPVTDKTEMKIVRRHCRTLLSVDKGKIKFAHRSHLTHDRLSISVGNEVGSLLHGANTAGAGALTTHTVLPAMVGVGIVVWVLAVGVEGIGSGWLRVPVAVLCSCLSKPFVIAGIARGR